MVLRNRRRVRGEAVGLGGVWNSDMLKAWISQPGSALVDIQGSLISPEASCDFALDMIELAKSVSLPLASFLSHPLSRNKSGSAKVSAQDIVRSLIQQVLDQHANVFTSHDAGEDVLDACRGNVDWVRLFVAILGRIPRIILVIDTYDSPSQILELVAQFWSIVGEGRDHTTRTSIKMLLLTYPNPSGNRITTPIDLINCQSATYFTISLNQHRSPGSARVSLQRNAVKPRRPPGHRQRKSAGPNQLRPLMLQFQAST